MPDVRAADILETAGPDLKSFVTTAQATLQPLLGLDICILSTVDPASGLNTSCEVSGMPKDPDRELRLFELEWFSDDPLLYHDLARSDMRAGALRMAADPGQVKRYVEMFEPNGGYDELRLACVADGTWWATVSGYRMVGAPAFTTEDVERANALSSVIARGFRRAFLHEAVRQPGDLKRPPGGFSIDKDGRMVTTTGTAESWLGTVERDQLSALTRALVVGVERSGTVSITVTGENGPLSFHATPLKGSDEELSVIVEYPRPIHLAPLVVSAYNLTSREREVTELVLEGLLTKQIARRLGITEYTVQDHLKSVFAKTDTATRGELCSAIYTGFYLEPQRAGTSPGPYGFFLQP